VSLKEKMNIQRRKKLMGNSTKKMRRLNLLTTFTCLVTVCSIFLGGCSSVPQQQTSAEKEMADVALAKKADAQSADVVSDMLADQMLANATAASFNSQNKALQPRFNISVNEVPARTFFLSLVADAGVNVVAHPEVSGQISLELNDVSIEDVLNVTRDVYGYEYKYSHQIYTIYPRKLRTEVYPINYLDIKRVGVTDTSVSIGKIESGSGGSNNSNRQGSQNSQQEGSDLLSYIENSSNNNRTRQSSGITPGARIQTLNKTDFWGSIHQTITAIIGGEMDGRMVMTNPQAGLVVVKALPDELSAVRQFLEKSELSVKRQVVLETKILEVKLNDGFEAGINWGAISGALTTSTSASGTNLSLEELLFHGKGQSESMVTGVLNVLDITQLMKLLETQGHVQVLSSPRISTVNNQKAIIRVGSDEFFVTGLSNNTTTSASTIQSMPEIELDSFFSGIALDVTPQISAEGDVILHVHPIVSSVEDQVKDINIGDESFSFPLALRDIRESDSIVKAKSGQVVVLGGLMQENTIDVAGRRPVLGSIPVVNAFFKTRETQRVKTELVILMRPVVVNEQTWDSEFRQAEERVRQISEDYRNRNR